MPTTLFSTTCQQHLQLGAIRRLGYRTPGCGGGYKNPKQVVVLLTSIVYVEPEQFDTLFPGLYRQWCHLEQHNNSHLHSIEEITLQAIDWWVQHSAELRCCREICVTLGFSLTDAANMAWDRCSYQCSHQAIDVQATLPIDLTELRQ